MTVLPHQICNIPLDTYLKVILHISLDLSRIYISQIRMSSTEIKPKYVAYRMGTKQNEVLSTSGAQLVGRNFM